MDLPHNAHIISTTINGETTEKCVSDRDLNHVNVLDLGLVYDVTKQSSKPTLGVNLREIHDYNVYLGVISEDEERQGKESKRTAAARRKRLVYEYILCNSFVFFVTITLDKKKVDRKDARALQKYFAESARKLRKMCSNYFYLFIPEYHDNKMGIHVHGCVSTLPAEWIIPYTMDDVNGKKALPKYIVEKVKAGEEIYHCREWDELLGFNTLEPIKSREKAASYMTKYLTKSTETLPVATCLWHSRGLSRAEVVARYTKDYTETLEEYENFRKDLMQMAINTDTGRILFRENIVPSISERPSSVTATISKAEHTLEEIDKMLISKNYTKKENSYHA